MRSLIKSKVSLGTTFLATNSPFTLYGRFVTMRSATSLERPSTSTISLADALLTFMEGRDGLRGIHSRGSRYPPPGAGLKGGTEGIGAPVPERD